MTGPLFSRRRNCSLRLDFAGDAAELWLGGQCVADQFYYGDFWEVGLGRFGFPQKTHPEDFPAASLRPRPAGCEAGIYRRRLLPA